MGTDSQCSLTRKRRLAARTLDLIRGLRRAAHPRVARARRHALQVNARTIQRAFRGIGMPDLGEDAESAAGVPAEKLAANVVAHA